MIAYHFHISGLTTDRQRCTSLVLQNASADIEFRVRLTQADTQDLAVALAGVSSAPARLARVIGHLAQQLSAALSHVQLSRGVGSMVEAALVLTASHEHISVPVTFADGMILALAHHLPIHGDDSLTPLLKIAPAADVPLPAALTAFLSALPE